MSVGRPAIAAVIAAVLAVVLWWLAGDVVTMPPPTVDPPVEAPIVRTVTDPWLMFAGTLSAGVAMVCATVTTLRFADRRRS